MTTTTDLLPEHPTLADVGRALAAIANRVSAGALEPKAASSTIYGLSQLRAVLRERDLEDQLKAARKQLAELQTRHARRGAA